MFTPKEIKTAFLNLYGMFDQETRSYLDKSFGKEMGISFVSLAQAMQKKAVYVFDFRSESTMLTPIQQVGKRLFKQKASPILSYLDTSIIDGNICIDYCTELWLRQDLSFAVIRCYKMKIADGDKLHSFCEYRKYEKNIESEKDIFFAPEDLLYEVDDICLFQKLFG